MFAINTGMESGGSKGPWINWTSEGSARKGLAPESWKLREKEEGQPATERNIEAFKAGCVLDLDSIKIGWEKDGGQGQAPERRWNPSISQPTPRPSEDRKPSGGYVWSNAFSVRCAIGNGKAATWEQAAFGAMVAFDNLAKAISAEWGANSQNGALLPLVKQTGIERRHVGSGSTSIPVLTIVKWVPRPDCLKDDGPSIATGVSDPEPQPAPQAQPAAQSEHIAEGAAF